ncbi:MAG: polymorphic toxin-type HINT domain-containing protein, partial [Flavobacterium sp.]
SLLAKSELTPNEANTILEKTINYNYKSIYSRFWTHIKSSNLPAYDDLYVKTEATYDNDTNQIKIETLLALGFVSLSEMKKPVPFDPFEPIIFTNNTTLTAFNEVTESKDNLYLPAFIVYYADKEAGIQTASDITQTAVDVATLVIPGGQLSTIGKVLFYADKVSSVTSIAARATAENNPEFSKIAGLVSIATGVASASTMVLKPSILKIDDYSNLLESINKSSNISAIAKEDRLLVEAFIEKTKSTLISEGKFDGAMTLKYDNALSKLRLGVNITNQESMVSRLISNYPKLENILSKTKNQLTFESATGILKYNGKAIANITTDAKDVVLSTQKVANIDRTATNMEAFTEEAAIFCKNGNCDLVLGGCLVGSTLVKTKKGMTPIEDINESDEVWSYNEKTKTNIWSTVVQKVNLATQKLYQIAVKNDTIKATSEHPFYTKKGWVNANLITKGMMVLLANGTWNTVEANIPKDTIVPVFNIEVVPAHTFYIGNEQVLVHNGFECFKTKFKNLANASDEFFEDFGGNITLLEKFDKGELSYQSWSKLNNAGSKFVKTSVTYLEKFSKLSPEVQSLVCKLTDGASGSTLTKFLDDCDADFVILLNSDNRFAEAIVGHKNKFTRADYENFADDIGELTSSSSKEKLETWINRSSKLSNFGEVVALGNSLSKNITDAIKLKSGKLFEDLAENLGLTTKELELYDVLTEVPLVTTGGFMKADVLLIKKNALGKIEDTIIIENKLSQGTALTKRQKEGFGAIINGESSMTVKYKVDWLLPSQGPLSVSKNKIFKIAGAGTDNIANVTIEKILKVN